PAPQNTPLRPPQGGISLSAPGGLANPAPEFSGKGPAPQNTPLRPPQGGISLSAPGGLANPAAFAPEDRLKAN
ncbi:MAG: hypothetical protein B6245_17750, partial [Desulfobacteraceae bacterium 4572_88]